ncbi:GNAT family N-acetyltransferase [Desertihabitans aurantiacus]|uniref:GNAT family N-acetyltransferase n=1 Tax=Desertihabitans aurantiacus TaxID=2282477 RepID=UPI000DF73CAC|nr:GNAT family N-acetyltransferase [Desertihabitans aurantiacus]
MLSGDVDPRPCEATDLPALEEWAPTGNSRTHDRRFARQRTGASTFYLAHRRQAPAEFVGSAEIRWDGCAAAEVPRCPEINGLQVWPEHLQSRGIGTQMLRLLEREVRLRGHRSVGLGVDDPRARALYLRLGYVDTGVEYVDRYTWIDEHHREHHVAELGQWLMKALPVERDEQEPGTAHAAGPPAR